MWHSLLLCLHLLLVDTTVLSALASVLEINKTSNPDPVPAGGMLNYTIAVNNTGNATATNVTVKETYDGNVTFVTAVPAPSPGNDTWKFTSLNVSETRWINISVSVNATVPNGTELHNVVNVTCDEGVTDTDTENTTVFVAPVPVLEITKTDAPDPVSPGGTLNYSISVNNTGNATATSVTVKETYDGNVTFVSAVPAPSPGNDTWIFTSLNVSETRWINISVTVNASVLNGTVLHNIVNVTCDEGVSDSDTEDTTVLSALAPVLEINKTDNPDPVLAGGTLNYSISVNNTGNATATNNDTWKFATLNVSETKWVNISVTVNASVLNGTVLHNVVNVTCDEGVTDTDTADTTVLFKELNCTCGDICVNTTGWWRDGGVFIASGTPIQAAINNATAGDIICVKDGTYTENVDVTKSNLTIRSEYGPSVTTVSASLNPDKHVFKITDQTNVTLEGFEIRDAHGTNQDVAGIYMDNACECKISGNIVTNISATNANDALGIWLVYSSNNEFSSSTSVYNISSANYDAYGIFLASSSNNNRFSSSTSVYNLSSNDEANGIRLDSSSGNSFSSGSISDINAPTWWDFYSNEYAHGNMWKHNGTDWTEVPGTNGVNTAENYVYANITEFSVFAPLGAPLPVLCTTPDPPSHDFGIVPPGKTRNWDFEITNCGDPCTTLNWNVTASEPWISVSPSSGTNTIVTVTIDTRLPDGGVKTGTLTVNSNDGTKNGTIRVNIELETAPKTGYATFATTGGYFDSVEAVAEKTLPPEGKPNLVFPHGFFSFTIKNLTAGQSITVNIVLPSDMPADAEYWKYGPTPDNPADHWYKFMFDGQTGAEINGNLVTLHFVDGLRGDDNPIPDGKIVDQGAPGSSPIPVPEFNAVGLLALVGILSVVLAVAASRKK
jgi:uncharacterized repeat protein (TIGR01451 family)